MGAMSSYDCEISPWFPALWVFTIQDFRCAGVGVMPSAQHPRLLTSWTCKGTKLYKINAGFCEVNNTKNYITVSMFLAVNLLLSSVLNCIFCLLNCSLQETQYAVYRLFFYCSIVLRSDGHHLHSHWAQGKMKAAEIFAFASSITSVRVSSLQWSCKLWGHARVIARLLQGYDFSTKLESSPFYLAEG